MATKEVLSLTQKKDQYTLITGACGGLGRAFVSACAEKKENLLLTGTSEKKLESLKGDFSETFADLKVKTLVLDLAKEEDRQNVLDFISSENIVINKLINNAGVIIEGDLERFSDDEIQNAIMVNCVGTLDLTKNYSEFVMSIICLKF